MSFVKFRAIVQPFNKTFTRSKLIRSLKGYWIFVCCAVLVVSIEFWTKTGGKCFVIVTNRSSYAYYAITMIIALSSISSVVYFFTRIIIALKRKMLSSAFTFISIHFHQRKMLSTQQVPTDVKLEKKAVSAVAFIAIMFFVFWMPTEIVRLIRSIGNLKRDDMNNL